MQRFKFVNAARLMCCALRSLRIMSAFSRARVVCVRCTIGAFANRCAATRKLITVMRMREEGSRDTFETFAMEDCANIYIYIYGQRSRAVLYANRVYIKMISGFGVIVCVVSFHYFKSFGMGCLCLYIHELLCIVFLWWFNVCERNRCFRTYGLRMVN